MRQILVPCIVEGDGKKSIFSIIDVKSKKRFRLRNPEIVGEDDVICARLDPVEQKGDQFRVVLPSGFAVWVKEYDEFAA
jgi:hypothetical protein